MSAPDDSVILRLAIEQMAQGLFMLDAQQRIIVLNQQFLDIYGLPSDIIKVGATAFDIVEQSVRIGNYPGMTIEQAWAGANARLESKRAWNVQQRLGSGRIVAINYSPIPGGGWVTTHLDVTDRQRAEDRLSYLALNDELTGAANRTFFLQTLELLLASKRPFALLCLDLDRFKPVNDTYGHGCGDELLRLVVGRLRACIRADDTLARLGGDEFAVLLPETFGSKRIDQIARKMIKAVSRPFHIGGHRVQIGASIGIDISAGDDFDGKSLMMRADKALYRAKSEGRGTFSYFGLPPWIPVVAGAA